MADLGNISKIQLANGDVAHFQDLVSGYTKNTGTITGIKMNGSSKGTSGVVDLGTVITAHQDISGKADKSATVSTIAWDSTNNKLTKTINGTTTDVVTIATIKSALALPDPMVFKGSLGTGGTITSLPTAAASNKGYTYKVITAGTYASQAAKVGDTFISDGSAWVLIPSGDEPSGTVTSVGISGGTGISVSGSPITSSGTISLGLNLGYTTSGNNRAVQADSNGNLYITQKDNNTTYTFANGTNGFTVTPSGGTAQTVTVTPSIANNITGSGTSGYIAKFNGENTITNGPAFGSATTTYLRNDGTWATPSDTNTHRPIQMNGTEILGNNTTALNLKAGSNVLLSNSSGTVTIAATDTTYSRQTPASGGTTLSLVNTGDMYTWNNKSSATNWLNGTATGSVRTVNAVNNLGNYSCAEGSFTEASGNYAHVEGYSSKASGNYTHAEGYATEAVGLASHAGGYFTIAQRKAQTTIGEYNIADTTGADGTVRGSYAFIIGNGTASDTRSNALTVDWDGNVTSYNTKFNLKNYQTSGSTDKAIYDKIIALGWNDVLS